MPPRKHKLGETLVEAGLIDSFQLKSALAHQKQWGSRLGSALVKLGFLDEETLISALSRHLDVPVAKLDGKRIAPETLDLIPVEQAEKHHCIPLFSKREGGREVLHLGMEDPTDLGALDDIAFRTGLKVRPVLVGPSSLADAMDRHYRTLSYEAAGEDPDFEMALEPEDTAPLVFMPAKPSARAADPDPTPPAPLQPPEPSRPAPETADSAPAASADPGFELGPEFMLDPPASRRPREVPTRAILRALTQLLIRKGVITREELMKTVQSLPVSETRADDDR